MKKHVLILGLMAALISGLLVVGQETGNPPAVEAELDQIRQNLKELKAEMPGLSCCTTTACNFCPLAAGKCPCGANIGTDVGVCGECVMGWKAGDGRIPGVDPDEVKGLSGKMLKMMYDARRKHFGGNSPGR